MPKFNSKSYFNTRLAKTLEGKYALVSVSHIGKEGQSGRRDFHHGVILSIDPIAGVEIWENGTNKTFVLPPDLRSWHKAKKGTYSIGKTQEQISGVDYVSNWVIPYKKSQPLPIFHNSLPTDSSARNFYGIGTELYGRANKLQDGSYTATKWLAVFLFPIYPVASFRILSKSSGVTFGLGLRGAHTSEPVFLDISQLVLTYAVSLPSIGIFFTSLREYFLS